MGEVKTLQAGKLAELRGESRMWLVWEFVGCDSPLCDERPVLVVLFLQRD